MRPTLDEVEAAGRRLSTPAPLAQRTLEACFDLREFRAAMLENGSVTSPMLREQGMHWLKKKRN